MRRSIIKSLFISIFLFAATPLIISASQIDRINGFVGDVAVKVPCKVATTENITLSGAQTIDGIALTADASPRQRVLVKDQTDASENGIYDVNSGAWTRSPDFDGSRDVVKGTIISVNEGSRGVYEVTTSNPITIGTSDLTIQLASAPTLGLDTLYEISDYSSNIATAVTAIGANNATLLIDRTVPGDTTVPKNINLWFLKTGKLSGTVEIYSPANIIAQPNQQIKTGDGKLSFTEPGIRYAEWWGIDGTADQTEINAAISSVAGGTVQLLSKTYTTSDEITMDNNVILRGMGRFNTTIQPSEMFYPFILISGKTGAEVRDLGINGLADSVAATGQRGVHITGSSNCIVDNCYFTNIGKTGGPAGSIVLIDAWESLDPELPSSSYANAHSINNKITNNYFYDPNINANFAIRLFTNWNYAIAEDAFVYTIDNTLIENNIMYGTGFNNVEIAGPATFHTTVRGNKSYYSQSYSNFEADKGASYTIIENNEVFYPAAYTGGGGGAAFMSQGTFDNGPGGTGLLPRYCRGNIIRNNTLHDFGTVATASYGILIRMSYDTHVVENYLNCEAAGNNFGIGIHDRVSDLYISGGDILNVSRGIANDVSDIGEDSKNWVIKNVKVKNFAYSACNLDDSDATYTLSNVIVDGLFAESEGSSVDNGITLRSGIIGGSVRNCTIISGDADTEGIEITASNILVSNNKLKGSFDRGIYANGSTGVKISNNDLTEATCTFTIVDTGTSTEIKSDNFGIDQLKSLDAGNLLSYIPVTRYNTTEAITDPLADGTYIGQRKTVVLETDGGFDLVLSIASFDGSSPVTFADAGDYLVLDWTGTIWTVVAYYGVTI